MERKFNLIYILLSILVAIVLLQSYYIYDFKKEMQGNSPPVSVAKFAAQSSDPFELMQRMQEEMQKGFGQFNSTFSNDPFFKDAYAHMSISPLSDFKENSNNYILELNIPGAKKNKISINTNDNTLNIEATMSNTHDSNETNYYHRERYSQSFKRSFILPNNADMDSLKSDYKDGVLKITIAKKK